VKSSDISREADVSREADESRESGNIPFRSKVLYNGPIYTILAVYMPLTIFASAILIAGAIFRGAFSLPVIIISAFFAAVAASLYCDFLKDDKSSLIFADIRGAIIVMVVIYAISSLLRGGLPLARRFRPGIVNALSLVGTLHAWCSVISLKRLFDARMQFETYTEMYRDDQLRTELHEDSSLLSYTDYKIQKIKFRYIIQLVFIGILALIGVVLKAPLSVPLYILLVVNLVTGVFICRFFENMRREQYYAGEGLALTRTDRFKSVIGIAVFILICLICAIPVASDTSLLPHSVIFNFLARLLPKLRVSPTSSVETVNPEITMSPQMPEFQFPETERTPSPLSIWMSKYGAAILKYGFIALITVFFIMFMISPMLNRGKTDDKKLKLHERLWRIIKDLFKGIHNTLVYFFSSFKKDKNPRKINKYDDERIRRAAEALFNVYSPAKKRDVRRSVTLFARLIIWGAEVCNTDWKPSYAPGEYCGILAAAAISETLAAANPPVNDSASSTKPLSGKIVRCGELFEQALYSADVLSNEEQREFKMLVEEITST